MEMEPGLSSKGPLLSFVRSRSNSEEGEGRVVVTFFSYLGGGAYGH